MESLCRAHRAAPLPAAGSADRQACLPNGAVALCLPRPTAKCHVLTQTAAAPACCCHHHQAHKGPAGSTVAASCLVVWRTIRPGD